ncbi:Protein-tyrosine kinase 6 [Bagarius yarrelli]|uniref:Tyrosine-protein kinase n=1 Tax=Bagarius yarrelli TaxID=175774 RepID=A0A556U2J7_BAGYA|nr:Protein-tyrosine kinase 6 [Bagarius yarrelli]
MEECCRACMPCLSRLWNWLWPELRYPSVTPAAEIRTVSGELRVPQPKRRPAQLYAALYDFEARSEEELSVKEGDKLSVIEKRGQYVLAKKLTGSLESGLVPANYVAMLQDEFAKYKWYYGNINRQKAEQLLLASQNKTGSFLVRISESHSDEYTISARSETSVFHFRIHRSSVGAYFVSDKISFATLDELIRYYQNNPRSLGCPLDQPCVQQFLCKHLSFSLMPVEDTKLDEFVKEVHALKNLHHPKLIQLLALCTRGEPVYIVTELMAKGSLKAYLTTPEGQVLTSAHLIYMAGQVAEGMAYLEDRHIVHRDLAARNILVGSDLECKVADFGLARIIKDSVYTASRNTKIPVRWTAPEAALHQRFSVKSDVWSFGVLLYEMMSRGKMPYEGKTNKEVLEILASGYRLPCPGRCPPNIYRMMLDCWAAESSKRPSFHALHSQLDNIYSRIYYKTIELERFYTARVVEDPMEECLNRSCPCLRSLWDRIFKSEKRNDALERKSSSADQCKVESDGNVAQRYETKPSEKSAVYMALWDFEARDSDELSFNAGDQFRVVKRAGDWWTAAKLDPSGRVLATGILPYNYLERAESITSQPWYFGKLNRSDCLSHLLTEENKDGAFLVRVSETDSIGQVLSVKVKSIAKHFKIYCSNNEFYVEESRCFSSLPELIQYYQTHPLLSVDRLGKPCIRRKPEQQDLSHNTVDTWELPKEDFTLEHKLGSGYFADVYRGKWKNNTYVAIKVLKNKESFNQQTFHMEVEVLKQLRHKHLISLFAICTSSTPYFIITEFMKKGNLQDFLRSPEGNALDPEILTNMAYQVADGMSYLEQKNSIHRDLAARNVLVSEGYLCKVADFGLARFIKEPFYLSNETKIPYKWTAPEAIDLGLFSNKSDVWSFGILLYEIYSYGANPYPGLTKKTALEEIKRGYRMLPPSTCPSFISIIMQSCWSKQPKDRPDFKWLKSELRTCLNRFT